MTDTPAPAPAAVAPGSPPDPAATAPTRAAVAKKVAFAFLLPLFFVIVFPLMFVSALHSPHPQELSLLVVGPTQVVGQIADGLDKTSEFQATHTDAVEEVRESVEDRSVEGAIEIEVAPPAEASAQPSFKVTTYFANAEGRAVASAVQAAGENVAKQLGTTSEGIDVAPLAETDTLGTTLFYLLAYTSLGAYLVIIVLTQVQPRARLRTRYLATAATAVLAPLVVFGLSSIWVGDYGASFGTIMALLGVDALYVFTVGAAAILIQQFLGNAATFGIMGFIVFLNFPSAGGASPSAMLPPFWQAIHSFYFGSGALESFRSIVYFGGAGTQRWLLQLLAWTGGLVLATVIVNLAKTVRAQRADLAVLTARDAQHVASRRELREAIRPDAGPDTDSEREARDSERRRHVKVEAYLIHGGDPHPETPPQRQQQSITTGEGAAR